MCHHSNQGIYLAFAIALLFGGLPAHADRPIEVSIDCKVPSMRWKYNHELDNLLDQLRFRLTGDLQGPPGGAADWPELALWRYVMGSPPDPKATPRKDSAPQLQFLIFEPRYMKNTVKLRMTYVSADVKQVWDAVWIEPNRLRGDLYPDKKDLVSELREVIHDKLLALYREELRRFFVRSAPLAAGGIWDNDPATLRLVLPLPWDRYGSLSQEPFRVACSWPEEPAKGSTAGQGASGTPKGQPSGEVELLSCGTGERGRFGTGKQPGFQAVSVVPRLWRPSRFEKLQAIEVIREKVRKLRPLWTYLSDELPSLCSSHGLEVIQ